jgi:hypothetical protein
MTLVDVPGVCEFPDVFPDELTSLPPYQDVEFNVGVFHIKRKMKEQETKHFRLDEKGVLWFKDRLVVPKDKEIRNQILDEAHSFKLSIHPGSSKMYQDLKTCFWWTKMKKETQPMLVGAILVVESNQFI